MLELRSPVCSVMMDDSGEVCRIICDISESVGDCPKEQNKYVFDHMCLRGGGDEQKHEG